MPSSLDLVPAIIKRHALHFITPLATHKQGFPSKSEFYDFLIIKKP